MCVSAILNIRLPSFLGMIPWCPIGKSLLNLSYFTVNVVKSRSQVARSVSCSQSMKFTRDTSQYSSLFKMEVADQDVDAAYEVKESRLHCATVTNIRINVTWACPAFCNMRMYTLTCVKWCSVSLVNLGRGQTMLGAFSFFVVPACLN